MITCNDIFRRDNMLCIAVADSAMGAKGYEMATERPAAKLYKDGKLIDVPWLGMRLFDSKRCVCFDEKPFGKQNPIPASELPKSLRDRSFELLRNLADALELIDKTPELEGYLDFSFSSLTLSSFYFLPDNSVFILSSKTVSVIESLMTDIQRFSDKEAWYVHKQANDFGKANYLFQLVYYSLTGVKPYEPDDVRSTSYKPIPISLYFIDNQGKLPTECEQFLKDIDHVFKMSKKEMYQVRDPYKYFKEKLAKAMSISTSSSYIQTNSLIYKEYLLKLNKKANKNNFLRKRGTMLSLIIVAVILVIAIAWYYIGLAIAPPETAGSSKDDIVRYYYKALNELDISSLEDSLARGCKSPDSQDVMSLYVTTKTRKAYENVDALVNPQEWLDAGKPAIIQSGTIFGVTNIEIEDISETEVKATFDYYCSYYDEEAEEETYDPYKEQSSTLIAKYKKVVVFSFITRKDWLEISNIDEIECTLEEVYEVLYEQKDSSSSTMLLTNSTF